VPPVRQPLPDNRASWEGGCGSSVPEDTEVSLSFYKTSAVSMRHAPSLPVSHPCPRRGLCPTGCFHHTSLHQGSSANGLQTGRELLWATAFFSFVILDASSKQKVSQARSLPNAVHECAIKPINPLHLLDSRAYRMPPVASPLQYTCDSTLGEVACQGRNRQEATTMTV
jgi:hypothetical protein